MATPGNAVCPDPAYFTHAPLDQDKTAVRLVRILPGLSTTGLIRCELRHAILPSPFNADDNDDYDDREGEETLVWEQQVHEDHDVDMDTRTYCCLSYTWGDPLQEHEIEVNGKLLKVRKSLWNFLFAAGKAFHHVYFWIDALCIDQNNTTERNHQVQQMGDIYRSAKSVLIWLGNDLELESTLCSLSIETGTYGMTAYDALLNDVDGFAGPSTSRIYAHATDTDDEYLPATADPYPLSGDGQFNPFSDATGKVDKLLEKLTGHEYWSRAWVTQEVLLAKRAIIVVGQQTYNLYPLATLFRTAVPHFRDNAFERIIDILIRQMWRRLQPNISAADASGLAHWGVVNLLHRFRDKQCAIRRDRIYSLLALCREGRNLKVDYDVPEAQLLSQVLALRRSSMCFCSVGVVAHALGPWDFTDNAHVGLLVAPFVETHMYACTLSSAVCYSCSNWVPLSWTRKKGVVFCLETACADTQGHIFWEHHQEPEAMASSTLDPHQQNSMHNGGTVHVQVRDNNKSHHLCDQGAGLAIQTSEWTNVYRLQFSIPTLVAMLRKEFATSDRGLNACVCMWPKMNDGVPPAGEGRLRFCTGT
ncbi:HET-domain-containing protein [Decorospora gaudefroyi]|uniref:HET-domain-containing protein n=1 Tax=Decorospora gaudefroyi TaxID=184978 RepID=A0A6A5KUC7_9PLEO|nr:HET-domain-containing protein [Decorospora gaudefroyi]